MKKTIVLLLVIFGFYCCEKREENFTKEWIEKLVVVDKELPHLYGKIDLYVTTEDNQIIQTNNQKLAFFFDTYYHKEFSSQNDFLDSVLNGNFKIDMSLFAKKIYLEGIEINEQTEADYSDLGFKKFFEKYTQKTNLGRIKLNKSLIKEGSYSTIAYLLYKNQYDITKDCDIGIDYVTMRKEVFKELQ